MGRKFISKLTLVLLFSIIVLFIIGKSSELMIGTFQPVTIAGMFSLIIGVFAFIKERIMSKKTKITHFLFQLITILAGIIILLPKAYEYIKSQNEFADAIIVGVYLLLLFSFAYATRNEHVDKGEINQAEAMMTGDFDKDMMLRKMKKRSKK